MVPKGIKVIILIKLIFTNDGDYAGIHNGNSFTCFIYLPVYLSRS